MNNHPHDTKWIDEQIQLLPSQMRESIRGKYSKVYLETLADNQGKIEAEGLARREANTRLRICVEQYGNAYNGMTIQPPRAGR